MDMIKQKRVKGTLRKKLSKERLKKIQMGVDDYIQSHPHKIGTITIIINPETGEYNA